jgi:hypothetical protein
MKPHFAHSLPLFTFWRLTQADARSAAILVNDIDAGGFAHAARGETSRSIRRRNARPAISKS